VEDRWDDESVTPGACPVAASGRRGASHSDLRCHRTTTCRPDQNRPCRSHNPELCWLSAGARLATPGDPPAPSGRAPCDLAPPSVPGLLLPPVAQPNCSKAGNSSPAASSLLEHHALAGKTMGRAGAGTG